MEEAGDDPTDLLIDTHIDFPDSNRFVRVTVRLVPESTAYPEGVKYRMHYGTYEGTTLLRYDNAHGSSKGHERHTPEGTESIEFTDWRDLLNRFRIEVMERERTHED